ncbi:hypothetical protein AB0L13_03815 [Saccharopolyspora shandongensis]|uniref:hypothetical protein n=1 Tax=Saccharopolyspora shandongensis TaxID=418495 RepID=UPI0034202C42
MPDDPRLWRRLLVLGSVGAIALAAGILLNRSPEPPAGRSIDIHSTEALAELLPQAGEGPFQSRTEADGSATDNGQLLVFDVAAPEGCPIDAIAKEIVWGRDAGTVAAQYSLPNPAQVLVGVARLDRHEVQPVRDALRSGGHCTGQPAQYGIVDDEDVDVWTKVSRPWFGEESALYRTVSYRLDADQRPADLVPGPAWAFTLSGQWLVAMRVDDGSLETAASIHPQLFARWDSELGTAFLRPAESGGGCGSVDLDVENLPAERLGDSATRALIGLHDVACQGRGDVALTAVSDPLFLDDRVVGRDFLSEIPDSPTLAALLETRAVHRNGAIIYRNGDSAAVFSTVHDGSWAWIAWSAYVRHCSAPATEMCGPDPNGPLGGADWQAVLADACSPVDQGDAVLIDHSLFHDVTGDGRKDALLTVACDLGNTIGIGEVRVYDGASDPRNPRLLQVLLRGDQGELGTGLRPDLLAVIDGELWVASLTWRDDDARKRPSVRQVDRFRWLPNGAFQHVGRSVAPVR